MQGIPEKKENLRDQAYQAVRNMICTGELAPGEMINEKKLIADLGIGRTPIREALNALAQENLTVAIPRRGTYVSHITVGDIAHLYQIREYMEPFIVTIATPIISIETLLWFRDGFLTEDKVQQEQALLDNQFHRYLAKATENPFIVHMMENIYFQDERLRYMSTRLVGSYVDTLKGHIDIIDCMLARDAQGASRLMREHIQYSRRVAMNLHITGTERFNPSTP